MPRYTKYSRKRYGGRSTAARKTVVRAKRAAASARKRKMSVATVKSIAQRVVSRSKETKELAASASIGDVHGAAPWLQRLTNIGHGDTDADRDGDKITLKYLKVSFVGNTSADDASATADNPVRVMIVKHKKRTTAASLSTADFPDYWTDITEQQREKYQVLRDVKFMARSNIYQHGDGAAGSIRKAEARRVQRHFRMPLNFTARWDEAATSSSNAALMGDVYIYVTCRNSTAAAGLKNVSYEKDLTFKDN